MNHGTLTNFVYSEENSIEPKIGTGATLLQWSDQHAHTIVEVKTNHILVARAIVKRIDQNFE